MMGNLIEGLMDELKRNRELQNLYKDIPMGFIGASLLQQDIDFAEAAIKEGNIVNELKAYEKLKLNE